ncbi:ATP-dependent helicase DinG [gamma proteobacterium HdN1]|nr:ATP-dependent helicase DinG [gamma proteobacterium HdN1]
MLNDELKEVIQSAYRRFLAGRGLSARWGQRLMIAEIAKTIGAIEVDEEGVRRSTGPHLVVVEAGTGTGKTVAYLIAAIPLARASGKTLVVSTATISLQEQLLYKDIPELQKHTGLQFTVGIAKGRARYVCLARLNRLLSYTSDNSQNMSLWEEYSQLPSTPESARFFSQIHDALETNTWDGDRDSWPDAIRDDDWRKVAAEFNGCTARKCAFYQQCAFFKAREALQDTEVVIANHDLVLADLVRGGNTVLSAPEKTIYIFDEGHHLPDKALAHFAGSVQIRGTQQWLKERARWLGAASKALDSESLKRWCAEFPEIAQQLHQSLDDLFLALEPFAEKAPHLAAEGSRFQYRFGLNEDLSGLDEIWRQLGKALDPLVRWNRGVLMLVQDCVEEKRSDLAKGDAEAWFAALMPDSTRIKALQELVTAMSREADINKPWVRWLDVIGAGGKQDIELCNSPMLPGPLLKFALWDRCFAGVIASATLTALGSFARFQERAGVRADAHYCEVPSPFDYPSIATLWVSDAPFGPEDSLRHNMLVVDTLVDQQERAGILALFTSRKQMEEVYSLLPVNFAARVLVQGRESKQKLIEKHQQAVDAKELSVIFGLASFAEGVDLPGDYCDALIIARLPFSVPDAPVDAALSEWVEARGGRPFFEISVPDTAIRLKQMIGRLIRTEQDRGDVYLLDSRALKKGYGKMLLKSLPPMAMRVLKSER